MREVKGRGGKVIKDGNGEGNSQEVMMIGKRRKGKEGKRCNEEGVRSRGRGV